MNKMPYNFSPGPAMLPAEVVKQAQIDWADWQGSGLSVAEIPHRGESFKQIAHDAEQDLRDLLTIPKHYHVLFLQGGARTQFAMIPMNLARADQRKAYIVTGLWSKMAANEAERYENMDIVVNTEKAGQFTNIQAVTTDHIPQDAAYVHYADNETINGVEFQQTPETGQVPLVADMSSNLLSKPIDVSRYGLIYASAQKNVGIAGITVVIIRKDLLERQPLASTPSMLSYALNLKAESMQNTPPTFAWYVAGQVFKWLKKQGGVTGMAKVNQQKADLLYDYIDASALYHNLVEKNARSRMNVIFTLPSDELTKRFLLEAEQYGLYYLKGHRLVGGVRASIYNAMPLAGVKTLRDFMQQFEKNV